MKIKCEICGKEFDMITASHLKKYHCITIYEYKTLYPDSPLTSDDHKSKCSTRCKLQHQENKDFGFQIGHKINQGKIPWNKGETKDTNDSILECSNKLKGSHWTSDRRYEFSKNKKEFYRIHPDFTKGKNNGMYGKKLSPKHLKALLSISTSGINRPESKALKTLCQYGLEYVGDRRFWLTFKDGTHKCPDFVNVKAKVVVEIFGDYWHRGEDPQKLIKKYKQVGWKCFVYWEHEIWNGFGPDQFEQDLGIWEMEEFRYEDFSGKWML
jgi:G:T-mismatch repair DNA endonuclease (very short patch repair protein)